MYQYYSFGLCIHSDVYMPGLPEWDAEADVFIRYGHVADPPAGTLNESPLIRVTDEGVYLWWVQVVSILVRKGNEIIVDLLPESIDGFVLQVLQGIAMGVLLDQRGLFTLHASAIVIDGSAVAFVGGKGWGKSTTAAAFYAQGYRMVTDDVLVVDLANEERPSVRPGIPQIKLWPGAVAASLGQDPDQLPRLFPQVTKRVWSIDTAFQQAPLPLNRVYLLDYAAEGEYAVVGDGAAGLAPLIEPMPPREACIESVKNSYALRFLGPHGAKPFHLKQCAQLAKAVPFYRLIRTPSLKALSGIVRCVEENLGRPETGVARAAEVL